MKYCLSARQPAHMLKKADEIKLELKDYQALPNYVEDYPDKNIIVNIPVIKPEGFSWVFLEKYNRGQRIHCALSDLGDVRWCKECNLKFYYKYPVTSFFELQGLKNLGVSQILIGPPLIFDLPTVKMVCGDISLRAVPNLAYQPYIKHKNGICGGWIRPEDTEAYGKYISVFEFYAPEGVRKEAAAFHIYAENKQWPGNLRLLINHLDYDVDNRLFLDEELLAERRMTCKQKCMSGGSCRFCENQFKSIELIKQYQENKEKGFYEGLNDSEAENS